MCWQEHYIADDNWQHNYFVSNFDVTKAIQHLKDRKHPGIMGIPASVIKKHHITLAPLLADIFNACITMAWVPSEWKRIILVPFPKKGSSSEITNYRGVAIQSVLPKLFDAILTAKLTASLDHKIPLAQHGFRRGMGTITAITEAAQFIQEGLSQAGRVDATFVDYAKAFDRIHHSNLVRKLASLGTPLQATAIIMEMLCDRQYYVSVHGKIGDDYFSPPSSIGQGSHLGPLMFIVTGADLPDAVPASSFIVQYADDTSILIIIKNGSDEDQHQLAIDAVANWSQENHLTINADKTKTIKFTTRDSGLAALTNYQCDGVNIENLPKFKYLGVTMDDKFNWGEHTAEASRRACQITHMAVSIARYSGSRKLIETIYNVYAAPIAEYALAALPRITLARMKDLSKAHRTMSRNVLGTAYRTDHPNHAVYEERCRRLQIPTFTKRISFLRALTAIKMLRGEARTRLRDKCQDLIRIPREREIEERRIL